MEKEPRTATQRKNPWKGLDSYQESEKLYGRDEEVEVLMSRIEYNVQTVVYGHSGIGKSSLIKAGIFPKARQAGMMPVSIRLVHTTDKSQPSEPYMEQIRKAVDDELQRMGGGCQELVPRVPGHDETLWEYLHRHRFTDAAQAPLRLLLVFDQFEEIFTLEKDHRRVEQFFAQLADVLNGVMPDYLSTAQPTTTAAATDSVARGNIFAGIKNRAHGGKSGYAQQDDFRLVFSLREDYLSYLERNTAYIPSMKLNRYCLQTINEEQAASIIMEPVPGLVSKEVAQLIIEKVTGETDFHLDGRPSIFVDAAILSLYLSSLYNRMPEGATAITADMVNTFGDNIIQDFYLETIEDISPRTIEYLEDNLLNSEGRRENVSVYNAKHLGGVTDDELSLLCEQRRLLRRFYYGGDMRLEFIHDILCPVVKDRRDIRQMLRLQERELKRIHQEEQEKRRQLEQKAQADRRRYRNWLVTSGVMLVVFAALWFYSYYMDEMTCTCYYKSFVQRYGWPVGVGEELSRSEAERLAVSYKLTRKGHRPGRPFTKVEVVSTDGDLLHNNKRSPLVGLSEMSDQGARRFGALMNSTKYYKYYSTENNDTVLVTKYEALDNNNRILYVVTYFNPVEERENTDGVVKSSFVWAVVTDANGTPLPMRDNGADRMQVFLDDRGMEEKYMFFDENGIPKLNDQECYGYRMHYDLQNRTDTVWGLDPFSEDEYMELRSYGENTTVYCYYDAQGKPINHKKLRYHKRVETADEKGNIVRKEYYGTGGQPVDNRLRSSVATFAYDELNRVSATYDYDAAGQPYTQNPKYYAHREYQYIGNTLDKLTEKGFRWNPDKQQMVEVFSYEAKLYGSVVEYTTINREKDTYIMKRMEHNEEAEPVSVSYYGKDDVPVFDSIDNFSKHIIERSLKENGQTIVVHRYYDVDGSLYSAPDQREYAIDSCTYSQKNLLLSRVCYDRDTLIVHSQGYEYKDGIEVARYARGIHGNPIRCPQWERDGLCYYRLQSVRSKADALSYVKPVNEYGGTSWAYVGNDPYGMLEHRGQKYTTDRMGSNWMKETITTVYADHIPSSAQSVVYVHLKMHGSKAEAAGLKDGDLLIAADEWNYDKAPSAQNANDVWSRIGRKTVALTLLRYDLTAKSWQTISISVPAFQGTWGCEIYDVYYTDEEYNEFLTALSNGKHQEQ